eukprot:274240-Prorocentrum_lima.AAC.1
MCIRDSQRKALFSPNTAFPLCAYPLVYHDNDFEWKLKRRLHTLCGVPWPLVASFLFMKVYMYTDISDCYEVEQDAID